MKGIIATVIIGAAVAGLIYYLWDEEEVKEWIAEVKDQAKNIYDEAADQVTGLRREANGV